MVKKPDFKLVVNGKDISQTLRENIISITLDDRINSGENRESDELTISLFGLYDRPLFGDTINVWLGYEKLFDYGAFKVQSSTKDFVGNRTELRATSVDFSPKKGESQAGLKERKSRSFENMTLSAIGKQIAKENKLRFKGDSAGSLHIASTLQDGITDIAFITRICGEYGFLCSVKNETLIVRKIGENIEVGGVSSGASKSKSSLPKFHLDIKDCTSLSITKAVGTLYNSVLLKWQDSRTATQKLLKVGKERPTKEIKISEPKSDSEALALGEARLRELQRSGTSVRLSCVGREIRAGGVLALSGVGEDCGEYSIVSVSHRLDGSGYFCDVEGC